MCSKASRRSMRDWPWAVRLSSSTERTSEPSCSSWLFLCRSSLPSSWRCTRAAFLWKRSVTCQNSSSRSGSRLVSRNAPRKDVEEVRDGAGDKVGVGKRAGIGLVGGRLIAVEFEVVDHASGRGTAMGGFEVVCRRHGSVLLEVGGRPLRPLWRGFLPGARAGAAPRG